MILAQIVHQTICQTFANYKFTSKNSINIIENCFVIYRNQLHDVYIIIISVFYTKFSIEQNS